MSGVPVFPSSAAHEVRARATWMTSHEMIARLVGKDLVGSVSVDPIDKTVIIITRPEGAPLKGEAWSEAVRNLLLTEYDKCTNKTTRV